MNAVNNWLKSVARFIRDVTGATGRRTKVLRYANDWANTVYEFVDKYAIDEDVNVEKILTHGGDIKIELTTLIYNGRSLAGQTTKLKNNQTAELINEIIENLDSIRRYVFHPALQKEKMRQALITLYSACKVLNKNLANLEDQ